MNKFILGAVVGYMLANKKKVKPLPPSYYNKVVRPSKPTTPTNPIIIKKDGTILKPLNYGKK